MPKAGTAAADAVAGTATPPKSARRAPGVESDRIHLAAVITPGIDEARRQAWLETLRALVGQHNNNSNTVNRPNGRSAPAGGLAAARLGAHRPVQRLAGAARGAVEAAAGAGAGLGTWARCGSRSMPSARSTRCRAGSRAWMQCRRPSARAVALLPGWRAAGGAGAGAHLRELPPGRRPAKLVQFYRNDALGAAAAQALKEALAGGNVEVEYRALSTQQPEALDAALAAEPAGSAWMLWLRGADLARLAALPQPGPRCSSRGAWPAR